MESLVYYNLYSILGSSLHPSNYPTISLNDLRCNKRNTRSQNELSNTATFALKIRMKQYESFASFSHPANPSPTASDITTVSNTNINTFSTETSTTSAHITAAITKVKMNIHYQSESIRFIHCAVTFALLHGKQEEPFSNLFGG